MTDFLQTLTHPLPNAVMTALMAIIALYWLVVLIGGVGLDDLDLGFDFDIDVAEPDTDIDLDTADPETINTKESPGFFMKCLNFINIGKVPFMLVLSTLKLFMWIGTLITTQFVNVTTWGLSSLFILIPIGFISIFFTKFATNPLVKFFHEIGYKGEAEIDFLGRTGKMVSTIQGDKIGLAEVWVEKNPMKLNVQSINGEEIKYGDPILIIDETEDKKIYLVGKELRLDNL